MRILLLLLAIPIYMSFTLEDPTFKDSQLEHYTVFQAYRDQGEEAFAKLKARRRSFSVRYPIACFQV
jgi:hypothetical protein